MGRAEGRAARAGRPSRSPSTSRTTRSSTRRSTARSRQGQYGAGSVEIWDSGTYDLLEEKPNGQLTVRLHGERLQGSWSLVPAHLDGKEQNWLLIKRRDDENGGEVVQRTYEPMLATLTDSVPPGGDWVFEVKFDGYRALAYCAAASAGSCRETATT